MGPLLTAELQATMRAAADAGASTLECSLDLKRSPTRVQLDAAGWSSGDRHYAWLERCRDRTIYHWTTTGFEPVARYAGGLIKLVPTAWGPPTFEIDGIKMLPTARVSPWEDAGHKVGLIQPRGKVILDTCGGLGYFAAWCVAGQAAAVHSWEKNPDVLWLRELNPWSPPASAGLRLTVGDIARVIESLPDAAYDSILHDPPRFGIAGELYSQSFYDQLARVLRRRGILFHYTGAPNRLTSGRNVPQEVATRLRRAGFSTEFSGDGVLATRTG
jgi:predicted methyltransferase